VAIKFACGSCGKKFVAKDEDAGRASKCPKCGWPIAVPKEVVWELELDPESSPPPLPAVSPGPPPVPPETAQVSTQTIPAGGNPLTPPPVPSITGPVRTNEGRRQAWLYLGAMLASIACIAALVLGVAWLGRAHQTLTPSSVTPSTLRLQDEILPVPDRLGHDLRPGDEVTIYMGRGRLGGPMHLVPQTVGILTGRVEHFGGDRYAYEIQCGKATVMIGPPSIGFRKHRPVARQP
jgi:DNA-directed RNA polymerase subunit RPC12/RpoP